MDLISTQLEQLLSEFPHEREAGEWLKGNPILVSRVVGGHSYANHVIAEFRLGTEYRADFVAVGSYSGGCDVHLVELEGPDERLFTKDGRMAKKLNEAVSQMANRVSDRLCDWRENREDCVFCFQGLTLKRYGRILIINYSHFNVKKIIT